MRKLLLLLAATAISGVAFAQGNINKGDWMVGGQGSFQSIKIEDADESSTFFEISPNVGYFFINQFAGGVRFSFASFKEAGADESSTNLLAGPFLRYYFLQPSQKVNIFADASYGFGSMKFAGGESESLNEWAVMAGPSIFLTPVAALEFAVGYGSQGGDAIGDKRVNTISFKIGFQIHLPGSSSATTK